MDPDRTFLRVHARVTGMLSQLLTPRISNPLEYFYLSFAVASFALLVVMHTNFVQQPGCSNQLTGLEISGAQLVQIKISSAGLWSQYSSQESAIDNKMDRHSTELLKMPQSNGNGLYFSTFSPYGLLQTLKGICGISNFEPGKFKDIAGWRLDMNNLKSLKMFQLDHVKSFIVQWLENSSMENDPTFLYAKEKGYFLLSEAAKSQHNVRRVNVTISACDPCFGNRWQQIVINLCVRYDTILMNSVLSSLGPGYLYNFRTKEFFHLSSGPEATGPARFGDYFVTKCSVLLMSLFVFLTTTMSVSFTLRETQSRMLKFTVQLQHHARHHLPTFKLIFVHVIESLVFVPIMIGILFFLFEFYDDHLLAFMVLTIVWPCELFTMISVRTPISMQFFPRFFLLYFLVFHIYFFSYAYGFSYLAFFATAAFMQHLIMFFWNRYEIPALQRFARTRFQIASSTILTSTLHIARVNVANPSITNGDIRNSHRSDQPPDPPAEDAATQQSAQGSLDSTDGSPLVPESNREQRDTNESRNALNPFGTLLLWILGCTSGDGRVSFFSMFRDVRDQNPVYVEPQQDGNEPIT